MFILSSFMTKSVPLLPDSANEAEKYGILQLMPVDPGLPVTTELARILIVRSVEPRKPNTIADALIPCASG